MFSRAMLFLNGEPPRESIIAAIRREIDVGDTLVVCADGAFSYLSKHFLPHVVIGDFDSLPINSVPPSLEIIELSPQKDFTDGHIATEYILNKGIKNLTIYGACGKRADHMLSNFSLLALAKASGASAIMDTDDFIIHLADSTFSADTKIGKIVSLVPYTDEVHILYTRGLRYPICDRWLNKIHILGISNLATSSQIEYGITKGSALVFLQK